MADAAKRSLLLQRNIILALLIGIAAAAWAMLIWQQMSMGTSMNTPTMGMRAPLFLTTWVVMMVAMMFPTAAPMILTFHQVQTGKRARRETFVATWVFVAAYLLVWAMSGVLAYAGAIATEAIAARATLSGATAARIAGVLLIIAGVYQLSPLKNVCLAKCRTPLTFILTSWRDGTLGAVRMGLEHGIFCLGCCWLLFLVLFPVGVMNIAAMAVITLIVFAEKTLPWPRLAPHASAVALVGYGALVIAVPAALPTSHTDANMTMPREMQMPMPGSTPAR